MHSGSVQQLFHPAFIVLLLTGDTHSAKGTTSNSLFSIEWGEFTFALFLTISETILLLATQRGEGKTICPSEVARALYPDDWRAHMKAIRKAAFELRDAGKVRILQKGVDVVGSEVVGPIRIQIK